MFEHTSDHLSQRFRLAHSAPCYWGQLFDDLGFTGGTNCAKMILEGTYDYPPDTNKWTKKILQEAHITFSQLSGIERRLPKLLAACGRKDSVIVQGNHFFSL
jgi:hypothetical protein